MTLHLGDADAGDEAGGQLFRVEAGALAIDGLEPAPDVLEADAGAEAHFLDHRRGAVLDFDAQILALDAFEVDAADYLLKPVRFERLRHAVERARRRRSLRAAAERAGQLEEKLAGMKPQAAHDEGFWVPERSGRRWVPIDSIDWIEAARDYVLLHTSVRSHLLRITMSALEEKLAGTSLLRVHRSAFVRPDKVGEVKRENRSLVLVLADGASVQVGPSYVRAVKDALEFD